ncbi:hypothetical protein CsSME_00005231 [Camellia sinensis var. sinensis]
MSHSNHQRSAAPHVALLPGSGMGHLTPFLRFAVSLTSRNIRVTIITPHSTVSLAESQTLSHFFSTFPSITQKQLRLLPVNEASPFATPPTSSHRFSPCYLRLSLLLSPTWAWPLQLSP